jgi:hypothetical protein
MSSAHYSAGSTASPTRSQPAAATFSAGIATGTVTTARGKFEMRLVSRSTLAGCLVLIALAGCASSKPNSANGDKSDNGSTSAGNNWNQLVYRATGTQGDGADDATTIIVPPEGSGEQATQEDSILPFWVVTSAYGNSVKVNMTVKSLSSKGTVGCEVTWRNVTLKNTASGDHAVAKCIGTMELEK